jgi:hypothetical protein
MEYWSNGKDRNAGRMGKWSTGQKALDFSCIIPTFRYSHHSIIPGVCYGTEGF